MTWSGVDKVRLHTRAYVVKDLTGWSEKGGKVIGEDPPAWCRDDRGKVIEGTGFFLNSDLCSVDLSPKGLAVTFNPSKVRHPWQLLTDPVEVGKVGDDVQALLTRNGILTNVDGMTLSRVDLARDRQLSKPLPMYVTACSNLRGKRMRGTEYPQGYRWNNTQRQAILYSKTMEAASRPRDKGRVIIPDDVSRFETRWTKGRPLAKDFGFSSFGDLRRTDPEALTDVYRDALNGTVFHTEPKAVQYILHFDTEADILRGYIDGQRGGVFRYLLDMGGGPAVEALGGLDGLRELMAAAGMPERTIRYNVDKVREHTRRAGFVQARRDASAVTVHTLIDELKTAFAA